MPEMLNVDFNKIPEIIRKRLVWALHSPDRDEEPIIAQTGKLYNALFWLLLLAVLATLTINARLQVGFGELDGPSMWQDGSDAVFYVLAAAAAAFGLLDAGRRYMLQRGLPFKPGKYLLPFSFIEAKSANVRLYDFNRVKQIKAVHRSDSRGAYRGTDFFLTFEKAGKQSIFVRDATEAEGVFRELTRRQTAAKEAAARGDLKTLFRHDPLFEIRSGRIPIGGVQQGEAMAKHLPRLLRWPAAVAIAIGLAVGLPLWHVRNIRSDDAAFAAAKASKREASYVNYLAHGHRHVDEIKAELPRVAFEEVRHSGSVTKIRAVLRRYPKAGLEDEVKAEVHTLYLASLAKFRAQATDADPTLLPFIEQLLASLEASGNSAMQVRFTRPTSDELAAMDRKLAAFAAGKSRIMEPAAPWFTPKSDADREQRIVQGLQQGFSAIFPSDVLQISAPARVDRGQPLMDISYEIGGSGQYYEPLNKVTMKPDGGRMFVGLICKFAASVALPEQSPGWRFDLSVLPPQTFQVEYKKSSPNDNDAPVDRVYSVMAERAFDQLHVKIRDVLFRPGSDAYARVLIGRVK